MTRRLTLAFVLLASPALAQSAVTHHTLRIYNQNGGSPLVVYQMPMAETLCNQPLVPDPTTLVVNPRLVSWNDWINAGRSCQWTYTGSGQGPLFAVPVGGGPYVVTLTRTNAAGESPESAASNPFVRDGIPTVPTGVKVTPGDD